MGCILRILLIMIAFSSIAVASGPPCWDDVPPANKYAQRHIVNGNGSQLSADGLIISTKRSETEQAILIEVTVTNCGTNTVELSPTTYDLVVLGPDSDKRLPRLDPTQFRRSRTMTYPGQHSDTLPYGRVGTYFLFFAPDTYYSEMDHQERLSVVTG